MCGSVEYVGNKIIKMALKILFSVNKIRQECV